MKTITRVVLAFFLLASVACKSAPEQSQSAGNLPNPPFAGNAPVDAQANESESGRYGGTLALAVPQNPKSFNPVIANETSTFLVISQVVYKALTDYDNQTQKDTPGLAKLWEVSPDGLSWTFNLRRGVQWSDGAPFTADDVLFTFQVTFDEKVAAPGRDLFTQSDGSYPAVEKADDHTVRFRLKEPNALFLSAVGSTMLIPKHKLAAVYQAGNFNQALLANTDPKEIVGLGPYRVQSFTTEQRVVLERNPYYWRVDRAGQRLPYIDRIVFVVVTDANAATLRFQNGETDMLWDIGPESVDLLKRGEQQGGYQLHDLGASFNTTFLVFNQDTAKYRNATKLKWFRNVKFRQAISYAIDREALVRAVFLGYGAPLHGFMSPANKTWYNDDIPKYPHDPEKAKQLLSEIGIEDRNADGKLEDADGKPVKFSINTNANNPTRVNVGTLVKEQLAKIGVEVNFQPLDFNLLIEKLAATRDFDAIILGWQAAVPPDPVISQNGLLPTGAAYGAFPNQKTPATDWEKRLQELLLENARTGDLTKRKQTFSEAMRIWSENLPEIDLVASHYFVAARNRFGNFKPSPLANYAYWNVDELYLKK